MEKQIKIALAGNPNCGKTTLFNALTGSNQFVGNWPGVTVEKKEGRLKKHEDVVIMDLPGIYSLSPYTLEEVVARNYLINERPDAILNIIDGTNLERNLYLTTQLTELGIPVVIAINMMDVVRKNGDQINVAELSRELGCKVMEISALKGTGVMEAAEAAVATAKVNMQYTKVLSPISGRISRSEFTEGALMAAYQATPLTRVQQLDPIYVDVTQKADDLMRIRRDIASGVLKSGDNQSARVQLVFDDGSVYPHEGELTFTDVTVNESTGMVNVRAVFPNPDKVLLPGLYVRANLVEGVRPDSIVIPMQCVMRDAKGNASVWVIDAENKIATRKITASRSIGTSWLVESGLKAGDRVVFEGFQRTRAGATVSPKEADASKMLDKTGKSLY